MISKANDSFDFDKLQLTIPTPTNSPDTYFTAIKHDDLPLYVQAPQCTPKQGITKSGKKFYTDIMLTNKDVTFIHWVETLETKVQNLIYKQSEKWFDPMLDENEIETAFTSPLKIYKSGKYYLLRVDVNPQTKIFDERNDINSREQLQLSDVTSDTNFASIVEIHGIKFTSKNFQLVFEIRQMVIVSADPFGGNCFIKRDIQIEKEVEKTTETQKSNITLEIENEISDDTDIATNENIEVDITEEIKYEGDGDGDGEKEEGESESESEKEETQGDMTNIDIDIDLLDDNNVLNLKPPDAVYYEIYQRAKDWLKECQKKTEQATYDLNQIKELYKIEDN